MDRRLSGSFGLLALGTWHALLMVVVAGAALGLIGLLWGFSLPSIQEPGGAARVLLGLGALWGLCLAATRLAFGPDWPQRRLGRSTLLRSAGWGMCLGALYSLIVLSLLIPGLLGDPEAYAFFSLYALPIGAAAGLLGGLLAFAADAAGCQVLRDTTVARGRSR